MDLEPSTIDADNDDHGDDQHQEGKSQTVRRLTREEWEDAKYKYRSGKWSTHDIAKLLKVNRAGLERRFRRNNVIKGEHEAIYDQEAATRLAEERADHIAKEARALADTSSRIKKFSLVSIEAIHKKAFKDLAAKTNRNEEIDLKEFKTFTAIVKDIIDIVESIVPRDGFNPDEIPDLVVEELGDTEVEEMRRTQEEEERDLMGAEPDDFDTENESDDISVEGDEYE